MTIKQKCLRTSLGILFFLFLQPSGVFSNRSDHFHGRPVHQNEVGQAKIYQFSIPENEWNVDNEALLGNEVTVDEYGNVEVELTFDEFGDINALSSRSVDENNGNVETFFDDQTLTQESGQVEIHEQVTLPNEYDQTKYDQTKLEPNGQALTQDSSGQVGIQMPLPAIRRTRRPGDDHEKNFPANRDGQPLDANCHIPSISTKYINEQAENPPNRRELIGIRKRKILGETGRKHSHLKRSNKNYDGVSVDTHGHVVPKEQVVFSEHRSLEEGLGSSFRDIDNPGKAAGKPTKFLGKRAEVTQLLESTLIAKTIPISYENENVLHTLPPLKTWDTPASTRIVNSTEVSFPRKAPSTSSIEDQEQPIPTLSLVSSMLPRNVSDDNFSRIFKSTVVIGIPSLVVGTALIVLLILGCIWCVKRRRAKKVRINVHQPYLNFSDGAVEEGRRAGNSQIYQANAVPQPNQNGWIFWFKNLFSNDSSSSTTSANALEIQQVIPRHLPRTDGAGDPQYILTAASQRLSELSAGSLSPIPGSRESTHDRQSASTASLRSAVATGIEFNSEGGTTRRKGRMDIERAIRGAFVENLEDGPSEHSEAAITRSSNIPVTFTPKKASRASLRQRGGDTPSTPSSEPLSILEPGSEISRGFSSDSKGELTVVVKSDSSVILRDYLHEASSSRASLRVATEWDFVSPGVKSHDSLEDMSMIDLKENSDDIRLFIDGQPPTDDEKGESAEVYIGIQGDGAGSSGNGHLKNSLTSPGVEYSARESSMDVSGTGVHSRTVESLGTLEREVSITRMASAGGVDHAIKSSSVQGTESFTEEQFDAVKGGADTNINTEGEERATGLKEYGMGEGLVYGIFAPSAHTSMGEPELLEVGMQETGPDAFAGEGGRNELWDSMVSSDSLGPSAEQLDGEAGRSLRRRKGKSKGRGKSKVRNIKGKERAD
ncbi:hypothetical protein RUND412_003754 [Rhizina undulata]